MFFFLFGFIASQMACAFSSCFHSLVFQCRHCLCWCFQECLQTIKQTRKRSRKSKLRKVRKLRKIKMPDKRRPCKKTRQLLAAQQAQHQEKTSNLLMAAGSMLAHAAISMRPKDGATRAATGLDDEHDSSSTSSDLSLQDDPPCCTR